MKCWIIYKSGGSYSDYWQKAKFVFDDEHLAKCKLAELNGTLKEWKKDVYYKIKDIGDYERMDQITKDITGGEFTDHWELLNEANDYFIETAELILKQPGGAK